MTASARPGRPDAILIKGARYLIQDSGTIVDQADLLIEGERVAAVGRGLAAPAGATVIDATGMLVMPGLVNAHTHLYQGLLRGCRDDLPLQEWLDTVAFPFNSALHADPVGALEAGYHWSRLGAVEMIKGGVTCCIDMDKTVPSVFEAWAEMGFRGVGALNAADRFIPADLIVDADKRQAGLLDIIRAWHRVPRESPLVRLFLAPATACHCTPELHRWLAETAREMGLGFQSHVAETEWDVAECRKQFGMTPLAYLDSLGELDRHFTAVHCVHLSEGDIDLAAERGVVAVHCPKSNAKLGSGIAPVAEMLARGVTVALGCDGPASNDVTDLFEEMRMAAMLQKVGHRDPTLLSARQVFDMATVGGAKAADIDAGVLRPGKLADVIILDLGGAHFGPVHEVLQNVVYCAKAADVQTTIINGRILMRDRRLVGVDEAEVVLRAEEMAVKFGAGPVNHRGDN